MLNFYKKALLKNFLNFSGRSSKKEFWSFFIVNLLIKVILFILIPLTYYINDSVSLNLEFLPALFTLILKIYSLLMIIPLISLSVRRLHDIGKESYYILLYFIPVIGFIIILIWFLKDSEKKSNKWGNFNEE